MGMETWCSSSSYLLFVAIIIIPVPLLWWRWWCRSCCTSTLRRLPPGPFSFPILGNLPHLVLAGSSRHRYLTRLARRYGPIFSLRLGSTPAIVVSSPALARELLHTHDKTFASRPPFGSAKLLMGDSGGDKTVTFLPYGDEWKRTRKLYSLQLFTSCRIREFQSSIITHEIRDLIHTRLLPASISGRAIDLTSCIQIMVENIICRIILRQCPAQVFHGNNNEGGMNLAQLTRQLQKLYPSPLIGDSVPFLGFMDYKTKESMRNWKACFDALMEHIISERERDPVFGKESVRDILDVFLLPENKLGREVVKVLIVELLTAGIVTSSAAIDWAMAELLANPHVLRKLRTELDVVVGREREVEISDMAQLPYLGAVLKETFRKHPPAALLVPHMSVHACEVGGYEIPKGTTVFVNAWAMGHDPELWKEEEKFIPERFVAGQGEADAVTWTGQHFELLPFGSGRRMCPGMSLAMPMLELAVSSLVQSFEDWEVVLPPGHHSLDMSDECGLTCHRVLPLTALPRAPLHRLHGHTN